MQKRRAILAAVAVTGMLAMGAGVPAHAQGVGTPPEPAEVGVDGETIFTPLPEMIPGDSTAQGQLVRGSDRDFFSAARSRTGLPEDGRIYRYFEYDDPREPTFWNASDSGIAGPVLSLTADESGFVYSLHEPRDAGAHGLVAKWSGEGQLQDTHAVTIPDVRVNEILAIDVDPSGTVLSTLIADEGGLETRVWAGTFEEQQPVYGWDQSVRDMEGLAVPFSRQIMPAAGEGWPEQTVYNYQISPNDVLFSVGGFTATLMVIATRGIDTDSLAIDDYVYYATRDSIRKMAPGNWDKPRSWLESPQTEGFDLYESRVGRDGRLYVSGINTDGDWALKPFDMTDLRSPELGYPVPALEVNTCATEPVSLQIDSGQLKGTPVPTWFAVVDGELPAGLDLDVKTGTLSGASADAFVARTVTVRAANGVTTSEHSEPTTADLIVRSVTEPIAFSETSEPKISGTPLVGNVLTVETGAWQPAAEFTTQWLRDGAPISGATGREYEVVAADAGSALSVVVTGSSDCRIATDRASESIEGVPLPTTPAPPAQTPKPPLSDTGGVDQGALLLGGAVLVLFGAGVMLRRSLRSARARQR